MQGRMPVARFLGKRVSRLIVVVGSKFWVTEHLREEQSKAKAGLRKLANWFKILFSTLANGFSQFQMIRSMTQPPPRHGLSLPVSIALSGLKPW